MIKSYKKLYLALFLFSVLIVAGFKNDLVGLGSNMSVNWESFEVPNEIYLFKNYSPSFIGFSILILSMLLLECKKKYLEKNYLVFSYLFLLIFSAFRLLNGYIDLSIKMLLSIIISSMIYVFFSVFRKNFGDIFLDGLLKSFLLFSLLFLFVNYYVYLLGMGYVYGFNRYFGATSHPNFLGVQSAICFTFLFYLLFKKNITYKIFGLLLCLACLGLIFLSGSRTAILFVLSFLFVIIFYLIKKNKIYVLFIPFVVILGILLFDNFLNIFSSDVYDRGAGGSDTRSSAWLIMVEGIWDKPLLGHGLFLGASENSYLRLAANYGIFYCVIYIFVVALVFMNFVRKINILSSGSKDIYNIYILLFGIFCSLIICGLLEGFLADIFSLQSVLFFILVYISGSRLNYDK